MAYKMALILSTLFVMQVIAFGGDLSAVSAIRSELDALALTVGYEISAQNEITNEIVQYVYKTAGARIYEIGEKKPSFGEPLTFVIEKVYNPLVISNEPMVVSVKRSAIIGYYF